MLVSSLDRLFQFIEKANPSVFAVEKNGKVAYHDHDKTMQSHPVRVVDHEKYFAGKIEIKSAAFNRTLFSLIELVSNENNLDRSDGRRQIDQMANLATTQMLEDHLGYSNFSQNVSSKVFRQWKAGLLTGGASFLRFIVADFYGLPETKVIAELESINERALRRGLVPRMLSEYGEAKEKYKNFRKEFPIVRMLAQLVLKQIYGDMLTVYRRIPSDLVESDSNLATAKIGDTVKLNNGIISAWSLTSKMPIREGDIIVSQIIPVESIFYSDRVNANDLEGALRDEDEVLFFIENQNAKIIIG